jgi:hypothetical protein
VRSAALSAISPRWRALSFSTRAAAPRRRQRDERVHDRSRAAAARQRERAEVERAPAAGPLGLARRQQDQHRVLRRETPPRETRGDPALVLGGDQDSSAA